MSDAVLVADDFRDKVTQKFELCDHLDEDDDHDVCLLELTECTDLTAQDFKGKTRDPFSLIFKAHPELVVGQRSYKLKNDAMGDVEMFLVPIGPDADGNPRYQAVFN